MKMSTQLTTFRTFFLLCIFSLSLCIEVFGEESDMGMPGGLKEIHEFQNSVEVEDLAKFAIDEHNKNQNAGLSFSRVMKAREQVVAGTLYHLTIEGKDAEDQINLYHAQVWVKPWENHKSLEEFKKGTPEDEA